MPYGIETPNLAVISRPYYDNINSIIDNAYGFKGQVRTDFLKDQFVPSKMLEAENAYEQQHFDLTNRRNTAPYNLEENLYGAQLGASGARDDYAIYPTMRGIKDQTDTYTGMGNLYDAQTRLDENRDVILNQEAQAEYTRLFDQAPGDDPLDRSMVVYNGALDSGNPSLARFAQEQLLMNARRTLDSTVPGSPAHTRAANILRRFGQYGTVTTPRTDGARGGWTP